MRIACKLPAADIASSGDVVGVHAEAHENLQKTTAHPVTFTAEPRAEGGTAIRKVTDERSSSALQGTRGGYGFSAQYR